MQQPIPRTEAKANVRAIVKLIRRATVCQNCGRQPIEWHHEDHPQHPERRIANLVDDGRPLETVLAEIVRCQAVCRKCHFALDGRAARLRKQGEQRKGEANGRAKLTAVQAAEIRAAHEVDSSRGAVTALAKRYGVSRPTICHVLAGRTWSE